jgi:hypothetical protein
VVSPAVPEVKPVTLVSVDYRRGGLVFGLNRSPEREWVRVFNQGNYGHSYLPGKGPGAFDFRGTEAFIPVTEHQAQGVVDHFKTYLVLATNKYQEELRMATAERKRVEVEELAKRRREAETRERMLATIRI